MTPKKITTVEGLAAMTHEEFLAVGQRLANLEKKTDTIERKMDAGFRSLAEIVENVLHEVGTVQGDASSYEPEDAGSTPAAVPKFPARWVPPLPPRATCLALSWWRPMSAKYVNGNVRAPCPGCAGATSTFEYRSGGSSHGVVSIPGLHSFGERGKQGLPYGYIGYRLLRCAGCARAGLAKIHSDHPDGEVGELQEFFPSAPVFAPIPRDTPDDLRKELREAELCASVGAWRAASAMMRSVLEKPLQANGYTRADGSLEKRIDDAAGDGVIGEPRRQRVHQDIRVLGNDVLHDPWREVTEEEYELAHHYAQRILEDLHDNRPGVVKHLQERGRLAVPPAAS